MKIIPDIYDKIGIVLREMLRERGTATTFTSSEVYPLYVQRYPDDEEIMEKLGSCTLKMYVPGMVWEYSKKAYGRDPDKPVIEFLGKKTYRFISNLINDNTFSNEDASISQRSSGDYIPTKDDFASAYRMICPSGDRIHINSVLDQIEINITNSGYNLKNNWRLITERNIEIWVKDA